MWLTDFSLSSLIRELKMITDREVFNYRFSKYRRVKARRIVVYIIHRDIQRKCAVILAVVCSTTMKYISFKCIVPSHYPWYQHNYNWVMICVWRIIKLIFLKNRQQTYILRNEFVYWSVIALISVKWYSWILIV